MRVYPLACNDRSIQSLFDLCAMVRHTAAGKHWHVACRAMESTLPMRQTPSWAAWPCTCSATDSKTPLPATCSPPLTSSQVCWPLLKRFASDCQCTSTAKQQGGPLQGQPIQACYLGSLFSHVPSLQCCCDRQHSMCVQLSFLHCTLCPVSKPPNVPCTSQCHMIYRAAGVCLDAQLGVRGRLSAAECDSG